MRIFGVFSNNLELGSRDRRLLWDHQLTSLKLT